MNNNKSKNMKTINIPGLGTVAIAGIKNFSELIEAIAGGAENNEEKERDEEIHQNILHIISHIIEFSKETGKSVKDIVDNAIDSDLPCHCLACMAKKLNLLTNEDIKKYGADDVLTIITHFRNTEKEWAETQLSLMTNVVDRCESVAKNKSFKPSSRSYEDMSKEELIEELRKKD